MRKLISILFLLLCASLCHAQTTWSVSNTGTTPGERVVATFDAGTVGSYTGVTLTGTVADYSGNWGYASPILADFSLYIRFTATSSYALIQSQKTKNVTLGLRQVSSSVYNLTANCTANERLSINYSVQFGSTVTVTPGDAATLNSTGTLVIDEPTYLLQGSDKGISLNTSKNMNGGLSVMSYTGGRNTATGAQLEFIIPANSDGTNMYGQGRIITVAGNTSSGNATGKMILGTRRSFDKLGTGTNGWYYGDDITIDGAGNVGIGTTTPAYQFHSVSTGNTTAASSLLYGDYYGTAIGIGNGSSSNYAFAVFNNMNTDGTAKSGGVQNLLFVRGDGNVGIGSNNPSQKLDVVGTGVFRTSLPGQDSYIYLDPNSGLVTTGKNGASTLQPLRLGVNNTEYMRISTAGNVLIGKTASNSGTNYMLDVNGNIRANKIVVNTTGADFVFEPNYALPSLQSVESFIKKYHHLPGIISASEMQSNGLDVGEHQTNLLQKTEELTLYTIEQNKKIEELKKIVSGQNKELEEKKSEINLLKQTLDNVLKRLSRLEEK